MTLLHLGTLTPKKLSRIKPLSHCFFKKLCQRFAASDPAAFKQRGFDSNVGVGLFHALLDGSDAVTWLEADIPHGSN